jgi:hypothetical protein
MEYLYSEYSIRGHLWPGAMQIGLSDALDTYEGTDRSLFKSRTVEAYNEYSDHPPPPTFEEVYRPVIRVHPILTGQVRCPLN